MKPEPDFKIVAELKAYISGRYAAARFSRGSRS
jgi:hypothetical protein